MPAIDEQVKIDSWMGGVSAERLPGGTPPQPLYDFQIRLPDIDRLLGGLVVYFVQDLNINARLWPFGIWSGKPDVLWISCWIATSRISMVVNLQNLTWHYGILEEWGTCFNAVVVVLSVPQFT